jgi:hypothetical protein
MWMDSVLKLEVTELRSIGSGASECERSRNNKSGSAGSELAVAIWHRVIQAPFDGHLSTKITSIR